MKFATRIKIGLFFWAFWLPAIAWASAPIAVFPLQELGKNGSDVNLPFTKTLVEQLISGGNDISRPQAVMAFMSDNRIRTVGHLETYHISRVREDMGVSFILLGTISQQQERPTPSIGLTLQLVRTSDARTVWSYVGHFSTAAERRVLGIGEPGSIAALQPFLFNDILANWPWDIIREMQQTTTVSLDAVTVQPRHVRPGAEVRVRVRLRNEWPAGRSPRVLFQADDQLYAATDAIDGKTYETSWVAGEKDGRFPVNLILEWPLYGRRETVMLGAYMVDGTPPLLEMEFKGAQLHDGMPVFNRALAIRPKMLVRKPLARWRLSFFDESGYLIGADEDRGNMPENFYWYGRGKDGYMVMDGIYKIVIEAWDEAGNTASVSREVKINRTAPDVALVLASKGEEMTMDMAHQGKIPLAFWRLEMWTKEGQIVKSAEGRDLPAQIGVKLPEDSEQGELEGFLVVQDVLGNQTRKKVQELFLSAVKQPPAQAVKEEKKPAGVSKTWVNEF